MTFCPSNRIVNACPASAIRARGLINVAPITWPSGNINGGADYSVDFSDVLSGGEYIVSADFSVADTANKAWVSTFGNTVTAWLTWTGSGYLTVPVGVLTNLGVTYQVDVAIYIADEASIIAPIAPADPSQTTIQQFRELYDAYLESLPTFDPGDGTSDWNNSGIITRSIAS